MSKNDVSVAEIVVGNARIPFEVPTSLYLLISEYAEAEQLQLYSYSAEQLIDLLRGLIPADKKPPSHRQEAYAKSIAKTLELELTDDILSSSQKCTAFLDKYSDRYREVKQERAEIIARNKALISEAHRVLRWQRAERAVESGGTFEEVAEQFEVKAPTIEKYIRLLGEWREEARAYGTFNIVMSLIEKLEKGEDLYSCFKDSFDETEVN
ncbi:hypothetical protein [Pseudoalteromonas maricaloris]|uniref:hypothetical protein n=1 Tax=Pseudoalteromonas maricaloris TaxID=184924 RepID=UPI003C1B25FD